MEYNFDLRLADPVQFELLNYVNLFRNAKPPVLVFPVNLGKIINKTIRYFAAMFELVPFYVSSKETSKKLLFVCPKDTLNELYNSSYEDLFWATSEDTEVIDRLDLHRCLVRSSNSLAKRRLREQIGLPIYELFTKPELCSEEKSTVSEKSSKSTDDEIDNITSGVTEHMSLPSDPNISSNEGNDPSQTLNPNAIEFNSTEMGLVVGFNSTEMGPVEDGSEEQSLRTAESLRSILMEYNDGLSIYLREPRIIVLANQDYSSFEFITKTDLDNVIEVYDIPVQYKTNDLEKVYGVVVSKIKWCDENHAMIITTSTEDAKKLLEIKHPFCKTRTMVNGSPVTTLIASLIDFQAIVDSMSR